MSRQQLSATWEPEPLASLPAAPPIIKNVVTGAAHFRPGVGAADRDPRSRAKTSGRGTR
jgi:hypothetical protein